MTLTIYFEYGEIKTFRHVAKIEKNPFRNRIKITLYNGVTVEIPTFCISKINTYISDYIGGTHE